MANSGSNNVTVIDGATNTTTTVVAGTDPLAVAVNPVTNKIYVANDVSNDVTVITEQQEQSIPLQAAITPLANDQTASLMPSFSFTATSTFSPFAPPPQGLFFQVDTWQGPWLAATNDGGGNFSGTLPMLQQGFHILYAYATDGQEATSVNTGFQSSPLISNITAYGFTVAPPPAAPEVTLSTTNLVFGQQLVSTTSAAQQVTLTNTGNATLNFTSFNVQLSTGDPTLSPHFAQNNDCGAALAPSAFCTINMLFTPLVSGPLTAVVRVISDAASSPDFISLSGTGLSAGVITPSVSSLDFGSHTVGTMLTQTVTLTNTGAGDMNIQGLTFTGNFALDAGTTTCPTFGPLTANASCDIGVKFNAYTLGANDGQLAVTHDAAGSPTLVPLTGTGTAVPFVRGEVFVAVGNGQVQRRSATGGLIQILDTTLGGFTTGMAFDRNGNLYVTNISASNVTRFDSNGVRLGTFGSGYAAPEVVVFDQAGNVFVGNVGGGILKFDPDGNLLNQLIPATRIDFMDLQADQTTMLITQEGQNILTLDLVTGQLGPNFATGLGGSAFALRIRPGGDVLVGNGVNILRLDANGQSIQTYDVSGENGWFALNLDPDGTSFWSADFGTANFYKFDIDSGNVLLGPINTGTGFNTVFGLAVFGEITAATSTTLSLSTASVNFPGNPINLTCPTKAVTITNTGSVDLVVSDISIDNSPPFTQTNTCSSPVAPGASCVVKVRLAAAVVGTSTGTMTITSNAAGSPHAVALTGTTTPACQLLSRVRTVTVLRGADAQDFAIEDAKPSCSPVELNLTCSVDNPAACALNPRVIAPSGVSTLKVSNLNAVRSDSLQVDVTSTSEFRQATERVSVRFADFALTQSPDVAAGGAATYALAIRPVNGLSGNVTFTCSGAPRGATCAVEPANITLDGASLAQVKVRVTTSSRSGALLPTFNLPNEGARRILPLLLLGLLGLLVVAAAFRPPVLGGRLKPAAARLALAA